MLTAVEFVNALADGEPPAAVTTIKQIVAFDPPSVRALRAHDVPGFVALAADLRRVFADLDRGDIDTAAKRLNSLLAKHPAHPHLAKEDGTWRLHHHPVDADLVPMWTSICAEGLARVIGVGESHRLGTCADQDCGRAFVDLSKNASRRFCSTTCQNRAKTAAYRERQARGRREAPAARDAPRLVNAGAATSSPTSTADSPPERFRT